ncbi:hypothetical protein F0562_031374 [Nyssa sinensis]|uniref:BAG domain-containing protein n=1 Tax=Nyssa sinensis TaxID=561372 RepID=A0A5J5AWI6_9ASTE|nr:hypothetical protein F0562_031374 [Nyssa sinensis]
MERRKRRPKLRRTTNGRRRSKMERRRKRMPKLRRTTNGRLKLRERARIVRSCGSTSSKQRLAMQVSVADRRRKRRTIRRRTRNEWGPIRVVEVEGPTDHGAVVLRQAFAKRSGVVEKCRGKRKELSPQDAAMMIQMSFRAYLIRRSQALRALRELALAKAKLKDLRALFNNFSYRRLVASNPEERQKFSERVIVLLLTVDAIEGADLMVRSAKKSMVDELEAMLDVVDPQPPGKSPSMRRRTFDMPDGVIQKQLAEGVAQVVEMLDKEQNGAATYEACF